MKSSPGVIGTKPQFFSQASPGLADSPIAGEPA
jgi:hypothetical protein